MIDKEQREMIESSNPAKTLYRGFGEEEPKRNSEIKEIWKKRLQYRFPSLILKILRIIGTVIAALLSVTAALLCSSIAWMFDTWQNLSMDELMYQLNAPIQGTNDELLRDYFNSCVAVAVIVLFLMIFLFVGFWKRKKIYAFIMVTSIAGALGLSAHYVQLLWSNLDISSYASNQSTYSTFIEDNYANPREVGLTFPEQKRNLIYIFLESMETTYADVDNGGAFEVNYIPELTRLAQENEDFSGEEKALNGGYSLPGSTWTIAGMFSQTAGIPLSISIEGNSMDTQESFFPDAVTIGDVLAAQGYSQTLLIGSDATFGGRRLLFTEHGNYDMIDYNYAHDNAMIPEDYKVFWGYEDEKLFGFAKEKLLELSEEESPFNLTMLTVDTHFEDGYACEECGDKYGDDQYANVIACSSRQVAEFVSWIQRQSFYENTTIVISGDHPTMDSNFCENVDEDYVRRVYTTYINSAVEPTTQANRSYTTLDDYPTTLAAMGVEIEGNRLALGVNLFSEELTLLERYGLETTAQELSKKSKLMEQLASIDEDSEALKIRMGVNTDSPSASVVAGAYDNTTGLLPVTVFDIANMSENVEAVHIAVWTQEDASDQQWIQMEMAEDGSYFSNIFVPNFDYRTGAYYIHAYVVDGAGNQYLLGETIGIVE